MAGRYKVYPEYKEYNSAWFDFLPSHWQSVSLKWTSHLYSGGTPSKDNLSFWENGSIPWLNSGAVNQSLIEKPSAFITRDAFNNSSAKWIPKESLVMALAGQGKTKGMVAQLAIDSTCNQSMAAIVPSKDISSRFLFWWLTSNYQKIRNMAGGDLRDGLNLELLGSISSPIFDRKEQQKIANFLDHETAKIDTLIAKQEKLIELLKEKRQAVISNAVTKGLNPDVPMKDSGVEWLGEVPEHWDMKRLKYIGEARNGLTYSPDDVVTQEEGVLVLRSSNIQGARLSFSDNVYVNMDIPIRIRTKENDLLICSRNGSRQLIGKNALITKEAVDMAFGAFMVVFRSKLNPYLYWVLNSPLFEYQSGSFLTSTINQLTISNLESMEIPLPPECEQEEIKSYLIKKSEYFDDLTSKTLQKINLLKERKTALISAAVTGKIDVRDWQPKGIQE
ncbi:restriction endonuclease subunit S [Providencia rettgeri]|uniref:Restriction endonuclease subunit S n=1 Tax=Providencia hangzhouensis TaxID=3031799 RepID=A0ABY9ZDY7_9GAMM|nr:restriction endonuclease subunit S [Providencia hangzhouensis]WNK25604.1 restriction endonuclease subunit S [Providencia hangzhouensis]